MKQRVRLVQQIWSAFAKYVRAQVRNGRVVDTQIAGVFR
jgi:hypothetical protein